MPWGGEPLRSSLQLPQQGWEACPTIGAWGERCHTLSHSCRDRASIRPPGSHSPSLGPGSGMGEEPNAAASVSSGEF